MTDLATFNFKLTQIYPGAGEHHINTCANPDCSNFGQQLTTPAERRSTWLKMKPDLTSDQLKMIDAHGPGAYKLAGADLKHKRVSRVFEYEKEHHVWLDQRTVRCQGHTLDGKICNSGFSLLSPDHLADEVDRLRNLNGVLDGPKCGACQTRFLEKPSEFALNGAHERRKDNEGKPIKGKATPKAIRVFHKPCKGKKGARFSVSLPHSGQKTTSDNLDILGALLNSAGILDIQRIIGAASTGEKIGISRIYDRIAWFEEVFLAYEREMLRRWREKTEKDGRTVDHHLSHDDMVLTVNWETASDRRNTHLNCAVTADVRSGYVYRLDVDFDPRIAPLELFNKTYLDDHGMPQNLSQDYPGSTFASAPKFSWQRPTGRLHEPQFFAACVNEIKAFQSQAKRQMPKALAEQRAKRTELIHQTDQMISSIQMIAEGWFGFAADNLTERGSFKGMTTRDIYTKAAHFILLKEILPHGNIVLTTEQEGTLPLLLPHIFEKEIREDRFAWLAMAFNKKATKPERLAKVRDYQTALRKFKNEGLFEQEIDIDADGQAVTEAFIADRMCVALRGAQPFQISNYQTVVFPQLWVRSPAQSSGELDKVVGFPILPRYLRRPLKEIRFNTDDIGPELRADLAPWVYKATLQPVSTFMNSLRERLSAAGRAGSGGARVGGSYIQGAIFNPRILISLLNIFRIHYNFFELRPYASPYADIEAQLDAPQLIPRSLRVPGSQDYIDLPPKVRRTPPKSTPAIRHGMDAFTKRKDGRQDVPDLHRVLYRPWLLSGTTLGAKFDRPWKGNKVSPNSGRSPQSAKTELKGSV